MPRDVKSTTCTKDIGLSRGRKPLDNGINYWTRKFNETIDLNPAEDDDRARNPTCTQHNPDGIPKSNLSNGCVSNETGQRGTSPKSSVPGTKTTITRPWTLPQLWTKIQDRLRNIRRAPLNSQKAGRCNPSRNSKRPFLSSQSPVPWEKVQMPFQLSHLRNQIIHDTGKRPNSKLEILDPGFSAHASNPWDANQMRHGSQSRKQVEQPRTCSRGRQTRQKFHRPSTKEIQLKVQLETKGGRNLHSAKGRPRKERRDGEPTNQTQRPTGRNSTWSLRRTDTCINLSRITASTE